MRRNLLLAILYLFVVGVGFVSSFATKTCTDPIKVLASQYNSKSDCSFPIVAVGDLQRTSLWEFLIGRESNDQERKVIIENISENNPGSVVLLGDMIFEGDNGDHWKYFDSLMIPITKKKMPLLPVIGNHEYYGKDRIAFQYLTERFPVFKRSRWYTDVCDSIAIVFLDSNNNEYSEREWNKQIDWFRNILRTYDRDSAIKGILVFAHHPPYTNSIVAGDAMQLRHGFVPAFDNTKKTMALITGHAHAYERFVENGKTFIVSGGGGGPRVLLNTGVNKYNDYYKGPSPRPFNYIIINKKKNGINFIVRGLNKGSKNFFTMEQFTIPYSN